MANIDYLEAICSNCGKITEEFIKRGQEKDFLCKKCSKKIKEISNIEVVARFNSLMKDISKNTRNLRKKISKKLAKLSEYNEERYKLNDTNQKLLQSKIDTIYELNKEIDEIYKKYLQDY